jgi:hypothetical protein
MPDPTPAELFGNAPVQAPQVPPPPGTPAGLPTVNELFGAPQEGAAHDDVWSSVQDSGARILNAAGYGFESAWGGRPLGLNPDDDAALRKAGILPDYQTGHETFMQGANEAVIRPAASLADALWTGITAGLPGAVAGGAEQAAQEIQGPEAVTPGGQFRQALATPVGMIGELASGVTKGFYPELAEEVGVGGAVTTAAARTARAADAVTARAAGVIGEGEAGYYEAQPLTPENASARTDAAEQAGIEPPQPQPPAPDVHALARRINPDTFEQYDALNYEAEQHRATIARLNEEREASPEVMAAKAGVNDLLGITPETAESGSVEGRLSAFAATAPDEAMARLDAAMGRLDRALTEDTPEMAEARDKLMDAQFAMRDLAPDVSAAYRQAREIAPQLPETMVEAEAQGGRATEAEQKGATPQAAELTAVAETQAAREVQGRETAAAGAGPEGQAEVAPPNVVGEPLGEPGSIKAEEGAALARAQAPEAEQPLAAAQEGAQAGEGGKAPTAVAESNKPPTARYGNLKAVEGTGETVTRGLSAGVEESAIERGLVNNFGDLPEYERVSMADQAKQAAELIGSDYETAKEVAMGTRQPPKGLLPESVFVGVEKRALAEGDVETLRQLATRSRLATAATTMGQRIRTLGERDASSPVGAIQAVTAARERAYGAELTEAKAAAVREIKAEMKASASKPAAWDAFLSTLECK